MIYLSQINPNLMCFPGSQLGSGLGLYIHLTALVTWSLVDINQNLFLLWIFFFPLGEVTEGLPGANAGDRTPVAGLGAGFFFSGSICSSNASNQTTFHTNLFLISSFANTLLLFSHQNQIQLIAFVFLHFNSSNMYASELLTYNIAFQMGWSEEFLEPSQANIDIL